MSDEYDNTTIPNTQLDISNLEFLVTDNAQASDDNVAIVIPKEELSIYAGLSMLPEEYRADIVEVIAQRVNYLQNKEHHDAVYQRKLLVATLRGDIPFRRMPYDID